jgi:hypothetical protein
MTTKISTAYDYYITQLGTLFSSKQRIPNPYSLEDNSYPFLRDSWGLRLGSHNLVRSEFCKIYQSYNFVIVLCREIIRTDHNAVTYDTVAKNLMEDAFTLREFFYDIDNMNETIDQINLGSTDPIGTFFSGKNNFLFIETTIQTIISETY